MRNDTLLRNSINLVYTGSLLPAEIGQLGTKIKARLNIKTVFPRYGDSHVKDKTVATVLSLTWGSLYW